MELREWKYMNPPAGSTSGQTTSGSSSGYKKRFEKLIKYHIDHASSELESITHKDINEYDFYLGEHYNTGSREFDRTIIVSVNKYTDEFFLSIFVDGKVVYRNNYKGYEKVLEILTDTYMFLPDAGTSDYDDLLTESLNEWKYMSPPQSSGKSQKYRYKRLLAQIDADKLSTYVVNLLDDTTLDITLDTPKKKNLHIKIVYDSSSDDYSMQVGDNKPLYNWNYEKDILELFILGSVIKNTDLCESCSVLEEFRVYENLF